MFARIKEEIMWIGSTCELIIVCTCNVTSLSCTAYKDYLGLVLQEVWNTNIELAGSLTKEVNLGEHYANCQHYHHLEFVYFTHSMESPRAALAMLFTNLYVHDHKC